MSDSRTPRPWTWRLALTALVAATALAGLAAPAAADGGYQQVVDVTFPTQHAKVHYTDTYDAARGAGRSHKATDIMGEQMLEVYAARAGEVCWAPRPEPSYGYMVTIATPDCDTDGALRFHYVHLNNDTPNTDDGAGGPEHAYAPGIQEGARVERGQVIGWMGDSGNAESTARHLHFEIEDPSVTDPYGTNMINPYNSLRRAEEEGDYAPRDGGRQQPTAEQTEQETQPAEPPEFPDACPEGEVPEAGYSDVSQDMFHARSIDCVSWWDVAVPVDADAYRPHQAVTREEMAGFAARLITESGGTLPAEPDDAFPDDDDSPYAASIDQLAAVGVVAGYEDGTFRPEVTLSRAQMAKFLVKAAEQRPVDLSADGDHFSDDDGSEHEQWINAAASAGFVRGRSDVRYAPGAEIRRMATATFVAGILEHLVDEGHTPPPDGS